MMSKPKIARYAASEQIPCFDFFLWLALVRAKGADGIAIDLARPKTAKYSADEVTQRFENIIIPGVALAALPWWLGNDPPDVTGSSAEFVSWTQTFDRWPHVVDVLKTSRLKSLKPPIEVDYTVTLRNSYRVPGRNSSSAWRQFAQDISAVIIEDYYDQPIHLHDRMALYAGAKMNFLINQGPTNLLSVTPYPFVNFVTEANRRPYGKIGIKPDTKLPWMLPTQHMVWKQDTLENLRAAFHAF